MEGCRFCVKLEWVVLLGGYEFFLENACYFWAHRNCYINTKAIFCQGAFIINLGNSLNALKS